MQIQTSCLHPHVVLFLFLMLGIFKFSKARNSNKSSEINMLSYWKGKLVSKFRRQDAYL